jgi:MoaA/NifB/PqqE/SkfB family radical SAM enzyme
MSDSQSFHLPSSIQEYNQTREPHLRDSVCFAPQVNLNFEQNGNATACCFNRQFILGTYPQKSIAEIWSGERAKELRSILARNELASGCGLCKSQLEAKNFPGIHARYYDDVVKKNRKSEDSLWPQMMEFELSNLCNYECVMCNGFFSSSIRQNQEKIEAKKNPYDEAFVEQIRPFVPHVKVMKFLGGEPFLNPLYYKIWELIIEVNPAIRCSITTNGSILNSKVKTLLSRLKPGITVSCESLNPKRYESIRVNGDFKNFRKNLDFFMKLDFMTQKGLSFAVCPMRQNWMDLPDLLKFADENRMCIEFNTVVWPPQFSIKTLPKDEIRGIARFISERIVEENAQSKKWWVARNHNKYSGMLKQIEQWAV